MSSKRLPVAEIGAENYRIVRHTHDVELATALMRAKLGDHREIGCDESCPPCVTADVGSPRRTWVRIVPALENSWAAAEGMAYTYNPAKPGTPGAFRAVEFV